ncbi:hypothetical protein [Brevibacillus laterosporus]|uniref:hypothetical protein n=1 Tax=Brevibacillus laterosporus TaxID=1465 RepID=UPI003D1C2735
MLMLKMQLEDLKKQIEDMYAEISKKRLPKIEKSIEIANKEFEEYFHSLGFSTSTKNEVEVSDGVRYKKKIIEATYHNLSYSLVTYEASCPFWGSLSTLFLYDDPRRNEDNEYVILIKQSGKSPTSSFTCYSIPDDEAEKIRIEVNRKEEELQGLRNRLNSIDDLSLNYFYKDADAYSLTEYSSFKEILVKLVN